MKQDKEKIIYTSKRPTPLCKIDNYTKNYCNGDTEIYRVLFLGFGETEYTENDIYTLSNLVLTHDYIQANVIKNNIEVSSVVFKVSNFDEIWINNVGVNNVPLPYKDMLDGMLYTSWKDCDNKDNEYVLTSILLYTPIIKKPNTLYDITYTLRCKNENLAYLDKTLFVKLIHLGKYEYLTQYKTVVPWDIDNIKLEKIYCDDTNQK